MADLEDFYAAGDDSLEEPAMEAPIDPYADMDPELLGGEGLGGRAQGLGGAGLRAHIA